METKADQIRAARPDLIAKMRAKFDTPQKRGRGRKIMLSFDELLDRFAVTCTRYSDVARECGITRERARQIYNQYFRDIFGSSRGGRAREKTCTRIKWATAKREGLPERGPALEAAFRASEMGLIVAAQWLGGKRYAHAFSRPPRFLSVGSLTRYYCFRRGSNRHPFPNLHDP